MMMPRKQLNVVPSSAVALLLVLACQPEAAVVTRQDSAGVTIVTSAEPAWAEGEAWKLDSVPVVDIGEDTDPHAMFSTVASAHTLSDGSIVVAEGETRDLRIFDSTGNWVRTLGRRGEGPGEFSWLNFVAADQWDTLWVVDETLGRLSVFHPDTGLVRTLTLPPNAPWAESPIARLNSGRWLYRGERPSTGSPPLGVWRDTQLVVVTTPTIDSTLDTVGTFAGSERVMLQIDVQGRAVRTMAGRPFGLVGSIVSDGERIAVATGEEWKIDVLGQDGSMLMSIRRTEPPGEVEAAEAERMIQQYVERMNEQFRPGLEAGLREAPARDTKPAYGSVHYGTDGRLWVLPYQPMSDLPKSASVFDQDGSWLGEVTFPAGFTVEEVGADYVLGVFTDEFGAPRVRKYRFEVRSEK